MRQNITSLLCLLLIFFAAGLLINAVAEDTPAQETHEVVFLWQEDNRPFATVCFEDRNFY